MHQDNNPPTRCLTQSSHHSSAPWTRQDNKNFERALVFFPPEEFQNRWQRIGVFVGKTAMEVKEHYDILMHDLSEIQSGRIELPNYKDEDTVSWERERKAKKEAFGKRKARWTEEEKERFLTGLDIYGQKWKKIAKNVVVTKTSVQVSNHGYKYFQRQNPGKKRRRASIFDITSVDTKTVAPSSEDNWITPPGPPTDRDGAPAPGPPSPPTDRGGAPI